MALAKRVWKPKPSPNWEDCTAAFRGEADAALRALRSTNLCAVSLAKDRAARFPNSPLALHILGHAHSVLSHKVQALPPLRRASALAQGRCLEISFTLATIHFSRNQFEEVVEECNRVLAVADPIDPALHTVRDRNLMDPRLRARIAAAREQLRWLLSHAEVNMEVAGAALVPERPLDSPTSIELVRNYWNSMTDEERHGFLMVSVEDLKAYYSRGMALRVLESAVDFVKDTKGWVHWVCPECHNVFLNSVTCQRGKLLGFPRIVVVYA